MRSPNIALLTCFGGAAAALLGLAWDVSIHTTYPTLAVHETPLDPLSPAHDLIAAGIVVAATAAAWAIGKSVNRRLGVLAVLPVLASLGWIAFALVATPSLPTGTAAQQAAADRLWQATETATVRYRSLSNARADGYIAFNSIGQPLVHFVNPAYMQDGRVLDPQHVESLVYENTRHGPVLVAAMYSLEDPNAAPPDVAGGLTPWHRHDDLCFTPRGEIVGGAPSCPPGSATYLTPWMLHVWLVPNRDGRFAADLDPWSELTIEIFGSAAEQAANPAHDSTAARGRLFSGLARSVEAPRHLVDVSGYPFFGQGGLECSTKQVAARIAAEDRCRGEAAGDLRRVLIAGGDQQLGGGPRHITILHQVQGRRDALQVGQGAVAGCQLLLEDVDPLPARLTYCHACPPDPT